MTDGCLNIGIIGCGTITRLRHAPEYGSNPSCRIKAVTDFSAERAKELADLYGCDAYTSYAELLADSNIDAVSVCTANQSHGEISIAALNAKKHVLCEKPMALSSDEARRMIAAAKQGGRLLMPAHNQRLFTSHIKAKEILESGTLGRVISFGCSFRHGGPENWGADKSSNTWFMQKQGAGFGVLGDLAVHKIDIIHFLLNDRISNVCASLNTLHKTDGSGDLISVEDDAVVVCKTQGGVTGTIQAGWNNYGAEENYTIIYCEKGRLLVNFYPGRDIMVEKGESREDYSLGGIPDNGNQTKSGVIDAFVNCIINNGRPFANAQDGYESIAVAEACIESSRARMPVECKGI